MWCITHVPLEVGGFDTRMERLYAISEDAVEWVPDQGLETFTWLHPRYRDFVGDHVEQLGGAADQLWLEDGGE